MSSLVQTAHRLIDREEAFRSSGKIPSPHTVEQIVGFIISYGLFWDARVREYLVARSTESGYYVRSKLLDTVLPLVRSGFPNDALQVYRGIVDPARPEVWYSGEDSDAGLLTGPAFETVLGADHLLSEHPQMWGGLAVELLSSFLLERQKNDWPRTLNHHRVFAQALGRPPVPDAAFTPEYDDDSDLWFYQSAAHRHEPHWLVAEAIAKALRQACEQPTQEVFADLADRLLRTPWALAIDLLLQTLYDGLQQAGKDETWYQEEAARLLALPAVAATWSGRHWRRLLLQSLAPTLPEAAKEGILRAIRDSSPGARFAYAP